MALSAPSGMMPVLVQAHAPLGVSGDPEGIDLAALLASRMIRLMEADGLEAPVPGEDLDLPLARCTTSTGEWHWAATCNTASVDTPPGHSWRGRAIDPAWLGLVSPKPWPIIMFSKGPYKDRHTPYQVRHWGVLEWRAVGNPNTIESLLKSVRFIGKNRAVGEGMITSWTITTPTIPENDWEGWVHADDDRLLRPVPVECAQAHAPGAWVEGVWALRPPVGHHATMLALPADPILEDPWEV